ncbi:predicted protein [Nematostella vectensis]|uniref:UspA domain-containing protein n=1 Tax=Nematostella vectensis TaxID=45351 RepID=A7SPH1_NEMVE|nr:universal stress protein in QAH/OAS sulfhydrylase 3'region [Nematostella vectensis]EDO34408.1 predicted protein [Nematostella vectensis]|eukprot:XP_001626508.1 predicted protein [Nematostella vectensis]
MVASRKLLFPIDDTEHTLNAFKYFLDKFRLDDDHVILCHVVKGISVSNAAEREKLLDEAMQKSKKDHEKLAEKYRLEAKDIERLTLSFELVFGKPGESIVQFAKEEKVEAIVMGSRDLGTFARALNSSVSNYVVHHADLPTVIIPRKQTAEAKQA